MANYLADRVCLYCSPTLSPLLFAEAHGEENVVRDEKAHIRGIQFWIFVKFFAHRIKRLTDVFPETTTSAKLPEDKQLHVSSVPVLLIFSSGVTISDFSRFQVPRLVCLNFELQVR